MINETVFYDPESDLIYLVDIKTPHPWGLKDFRYCYCEIASGCSGTACGAGFALQLKGV